MKLPGESASDDNKEPFWEELLFKYRYQTLFLLLGAILTAFGLFLLRDTGDVSSGGIEVLEDVTESDLQQEVVVEIAGAVENPGVYKLSSNSRIEDLLISAGGISANADRDWLSKALNRASKITDGQKIYIPYEGEQSEVLSANNSGGYQTISSNFGAESGGLININKATQKELESLPGIGPVYGQNIIEQRPYSTTQELVERGVLRQSTYEKIKDKITVY